MPEKDRDKVRERDHRYGRLLKPCCDQAHTVAPLAEAAEPLNPDTVCVVLVSDLLIRLLLLFIFRATPQLRTRYTDTVLLAECDVRPSSIDLVNKYPFRPSAGTVVIFDERFLELFRFIECFKGNPGHARIAMLIKDNLKLCSKLCRCFDLAPDDRPDPRLRKAHNAMLYAVRGYPHVFLLLVESEDDKISVNHLPVSHRIAFGHVAFEIAKVTFHVSKHLSDRGTDL